MEGMVGVWGHMAALLKLVVTAVVKQQEGMVALVEDLCMEFHRLQELLSRVDIQKVAIIHCHPTKISINNQGNHQHQEFPVEGFIKAGHRFILSRCLTDA
jgi:hypothetical protein